MSAIPLDPAAAPVPPAAADVAGTERQSDLVDLGSGPQDDLVEQAWRFFCSLRLMVALMGLLILAMAAGTFINPQEDALANIERAFADRPFTLWLYRSFELYAPFKSWWFTLLLVLLGLNNIASSIERLPRIFFIVRNPELRLSEKVLRGVRNKRTAPRGELDEAKIRARFERAGYRVVTRRDEGGVTHLFGERGSWTRFGVWVVHLALIVILFGGILGRLYGFEGTMDLPENGGTQDFMRERMPDGTILTRPLGGFAVRCDNFDLDRFKDGSARRFASDLSVLDPAGEVIHRKRIIVNDPLKWGGLTFYQASYQERPDQSHAVVQLARPATGETKRVSATPAQPFWLGDGEVRYTVVDYQPAFGELGPAVQVVREQGPLPGTPEAAARPAESSSFWVFQRYPDFDREHRGDDFALTFEKLEPMYVTGIQVGYDPGVLWVYLGCVLMGAGLFVTFWTAHRRLWARLEPDRVTVAGAAHRNKEVFREEFEQLADGLGLAGRRAPAGGPPSDGDA